MQRIVQFNINVLFRMANKGVDDAELYSIDIEVYRLLLREIWMKMQVDIIPIILKEYYETEASKLPNSPGTRVP